MKEEFSGMRKSTYIELYYVEWSKNKAKKMLDSVKGIAATQHALH